jgi:hypothetical protein
MSGAGREPVDEAPDVDPVERAQTEFLRRLLDADTPIAGDVVEVGTSTWAIHGSIPVDGEVILAEYATAEQARLALAMLAMRSQPGRVSRGRP